MGLGESVIHPTYGRGVVKESRNKGFYLIVQFENGCTRQVRVIEVQFEKTLPPPKSTIPAGVPAVRPMQESTFEARRIIESLRLGIAPYDRIEELTFGREPETRKLGAWLQQPHVPAALVCGDYGSGKTHLVRWTLGHALHKGWAVALVEIDLDEVPFHKPKRIYYRAVTTLKYRDPHTGHCSDFRQLVCAGLRTGALRDHTYFQHLQGKDDEEMWEWIEGNEMTRPVRWAASSWTYDDRAYGYLPPLYGYSTAANLYCYLLSGLGSAAQSIGLRGLLLLFDEAESIASAMYRYQTEAGRNVLLALLCTAGGDPSLLNSPDASDSTLKYCAIGPGRDVPFLFKRESGLKLCLATTPCTAREIRMAAREVGQGLLSLDLKPLNKAALDQAFRHIRQLYSTAYGEKPRDVEVNDLLTAIEASNGPTRCFVKGTVELLDIGRLGQQ